MTTEPNADDLMEEGHLLNIWTMIETSVIVGEPAAVSTTSRTFKPSQYLQIYCSKGNQHQRCLQIRRSQ